MREESDWFLSFNCIYRLIYSGSCFGFTDFSERRKILYWLVSASGLACRFDFSEPRIRYTDFECEESANTFTDFRQAKNFYWLFRGNYWLLKRVYWLSDRIYWLFIWKNPKQNTDFQSGTCEASAFTDFCKTGDCLEKIPTSEVVRKDLLTFEIEMNRKNLLTFIFGKTVGKKSAAIQRGVEKIYWLLFLTDGGELPQKILTFKFRQRKYRLLPKRFTDFYFPRRLRKVLTFRGGAKYFTDFYFRSPKDLLTFLLTFIRRVRDSPRFEILTFLRGNSRKTLLTSYIYFYIEDTDLYINFYWLLDKDILTFY